MTKSTSYRETFRRHRRLLITPIILAVVIAGWAVMGSPKSYQSTASLWVDTPASPNSPSGSSGSLNPPSQDEQNVITELLATRAFALKVASSSTLRSYLATHVGGGWGPSALLGHLGGTSPLDDRVVEALGPSQVVTTMPGPQVLQIAYTGPSPAVAQSTLQGLIKALQEDSASFTAQHNHVVAGYYKAQVDAATKAVTAARAEANQYLAQHPNANASDPNFSTLSAAEQAATTQLAQANANLALNASSGGQAVDVVDPPTLPTGPTAGKSKVLLGIVGGLLAGALISFLGTVALTQSKSKGWDEETTSPSAPSYPDLPFINGNRRVTAPARADEPIRSAGRS